MGGTALKHLGFESRRISKEEYFEIVSEIRKIGRKHFTAFYDILHYTSKPDHGDIDFVGLYVPPLGESVDIKGIFNANFYSQNSCVHSFDYKGVQIDLAIQESLDAFTYYYLFSCFSPIGNVLGRMVEQKGLKWGIDGLTYPIKLSDFEQLGNIKLDIRGPYCTFEKLLEFAGLDNNFGDCFERFKGTFETQEDIFKWLSKSNLFNKDIFAFENLNHVNRKRDRVRKDYHNWLEYIKDKPNKFVGNKDKTVYIEEISNCFNRDINKEAEVLISRHSYKKFLKEKFNGKMVSEWTGLQGEELGKAIKAYKDSIQDFDNFIQLKTPENIEKNFKEFWKKVLDLSYE
jgi:hypothetical protein